MPIAMTLTQYGIVVIDEEKRILWEWLKGDPMIYGLDVDPGTGNFYVTLFEEICEVTRGRSIVWRYSNPEMVTVHSLQLTSEGNLLVASCSNDRVLEINKHEGIVWKWLARDHYVPPEGYEERLAWGFPKIHGWEWTHLNHAWRLPTGDTLIGFYYKPSRILPRFEDPGGLAICVSGDGDVLWEWGEGILNHSHHLIPYGGEFLVADSWGQKILKFKPDEGVTWEMSFPHENPQRNQPLCIEPLPNGNLLVTFPSSKKLLEVTFDKEVVWEYHIPETITKSHLYEPGLPGRAGWPFVAKYLPEWSLDYTEEEERKIMEHLRSLGYVG